MRISILILSVLLLAGCKEESKNELKSAQPEIENIQVKTEEKNDELQSKVPTYDFDGMEHMLHVEDDKVHVVNFWATWCAPCVKELPYFEKLNAEGGNNVEVLLVSLDIKAKNLNSYLDKNPLQSKVVYLDDSAQNTWIPKVSEEWSGAIPATVIYTKDKRQFYERSFTYEELIQEVEQFK